MGSIADNIRRFHTIVPEGVEIVAVSKFHPVEALREAYDAGQRIFGESRQQELVLKVSQMPADTVWHFIGHLQTNKVKSILPLVSLIESVDTEKLLDIIDRESAKAGINSRVLMQVHVAKEETKFGFSPEELIEFFEQKRHLKLKATTICGIMGMASNTDDTDRITQDFRQIAEVFYKIQEIATDLTDFSTLSMGMSDDFPLAIAEGSNLVRIGTAIFGAREY